MKKRFASLMILSALLASTCLFSGCDYFTITQQSQSATQSEVEATEADVIDTDAYQALRKDLTRAREKSGAAYVYVLVPDQNGDFLITVDGSEEPDEFLYNYGKEAQFAEAWNGMPASARSAWDEGEATTPIWSSFAPIYNTENKIVGILGVDYPAPELADFPEWNRNHKDWNGFEDKITVAVPEPVQGAMDLSLEHAKEIAEGLKGQWADTFGTFMEDKL